MLYLYLFALLDYMSKIFGSVLALLPIQVKALEDQYHEYLHCAHILFLNRSSPN